MKTALLIILLLLLSQPTKIPQQPECKHYVVGRFFITETSQGYRAQTDDYVSCYYNTMYRSIQAAINKK